MKMIWMQNLTIQKDVCYANMCVKYLSDRYGTYLFTWDDGG